VPNRREFIRLSGAGAFAGFFHGAKNPGAARQIESVARRTVRRGKLADVNTRNIRAAVELGCQSMGRVFNEDDGEVGAPFFWINVRPGVGMSFADAFSDAQVPAKCLLGLLTAERVFGVRLDPDVVDRYARVAFFSYSGPVSFPLNRDAIGGKLVNFLPVNIAHGLHALYALAALRGSDRAHELAESSIAAVSSLWDANRGWDRSHLEGTLGLKYRDVQPDAPFIAGLAMAIGPLAKYHRATGSPAALALATELKDKVIAEHFLPSGEYDPRLLGAHVQNVVYVMASLAWLATVTHDASLMARVKAFYDNGLKRLRNNIGWSPEYFGRPAHVTGPRGTNTDRGEAGNTALVLETALLLGDWGYLDGFADAELMLRSHLLPSQLRDVSFIAPPGSPQNHADTARRLQGLWGFPAPYGHQPLGDRIVGVGTDIVGPVVYALAEAQARAVSHRQGHLSINLLFDYKDAGIEVTPAYSSNALTVACHATQPVMVRIPAWVQPERIELMGASRESGDVIGGFLRVSRTAADRFSVRFPLSVRGFDLSVGEHALRARARGDEIVAMEDRGTDLTFFDRFAS
jgi:hypothetical protein